MAKISRVVGTTGLILQIFVADSSSASGAGLTGLVFNTASLTAYYKRNTANAAVAITLVTATLGTFASGGFKEIDATNMPGWYELHLPNAAIATGADSVGVHLKGATNMVPVAIEIELTAVNNQDAAAFGMSRLDVAASTLATAANLATVAGYLDTEVAAILAAVDTEVGDIRTRVLLALPAIAAGASGGLPTGDGSGRVTVGALVAGAITAASIADDAITAAKIATGAIDADALATDAATEIANGLLDLANGVETSLTVRQALRLYAAVLAGTTVRTGNVTDFKRPDDTTVGISVTSSGDGSRTLRTVGTL